MTLKYLILLLCGATALSSCEKVIDIPLEESERRIVVEGQLKNLPGYSFIKLSKTGSVYDDSGFEKLGSASVQVSDDQGNTYTFVEQVVGSGEYRHASFVTQANTIYTLNLTAEGETIKSTCMTNSIPSFTSTGYTIEVNAGAGFGGTDEPDSLAQVSFIVPDPFSERNFYQIKAWVNGEFDDSQYLYDDISFNGNEVNSVLFGAEIERGDHVLLEVVSMDEANHKYIESTANAMNSDGPFGATPANPVSNLSGNAIGYFGAFMVDTTSLVIPE